MNLPGYVEARLRRHPPAEVEIVPGSTPVLSFGDPTKARVATVGLNPSDREFLDLADNDRRLETLRSLNVATLVDAPVHVLKAVVAGCNGYFRRNPYWLFDRLKPVLNACGASYRDGTACHLDLVQWATTQKWSDIWPGVHTILLRDDVPFLIEQLQHSDIRVLLLNGATVVREFTAATDAVIAQHSGNTRGMATISVGRGPRDMLVIGWSTNLLSRWVSNKRSAEIAKAVTAIIEGDIRG